MKLAALFKEIIATYQKFGWTLRGILLTADARRELIQTLNLIDESVSIEESDINAIWFMRSADGIRETWEVRLLSQSPFALLETFALNTAPPERARIAAAMLDKLRANVNKIKV